MEETQLVLRRIVMSDTVSLGLLIDKKAEILHTPLATVELPWRGNEPFLSCIPEGVYTYNVKFHKTFDIRVLEILAVPNRSGILIHPANFVRELKGCVAPGLSFAFLDGDDIIDVKDSRKALTRLTHQITSVGLLHVINCVR